MNTTIRYPKIMDTPDELEILDAFREFDRQLIKKYDTYCPNYNQVKNATYKLLTGNYDLMDYKAYRFFYKCLMYQETCVISDLAVYENDNMEELEKHPMAKKCFNDILKDHKNKLSSCKLKLQSTEGLVKEPRVLHWTKLTK